MQTEPPRHGRLRALFSGRPKALISFALTLSLGVFVLMEALTYQLGQLNRMGPGYFPAILGVGLIILSVILLFERDSEASEGLPKRVVPVLVIPLSMGVFAFMIERFGVYPATTALVLIASLADRRIRPGLALVMAVAVPVAITVVFVRLLSLPIKPFNW